jgi:flagellar biosynthetic protein FlhB
VAAVVYAYCKANVRHFTALPSMTLDLAVREGIHLFLSGVMSIVVIFIILALIDVPLQRFFFLRGQRMSKQEVKEEHKSNEGRPEVKSRIRQIQRQLARRSVRATVPQADAVIVNPEHYAVAVRYDSSAPKRPMSSPRAWTRWPSTSATLPPATRWRCEPAAAGAPFTTPAR